MTNIAIDDSSLGTKGLAGSTKKQTDKPTDKPNKQQLGAAKQLQAKRHFCPEGVDPYDTVDWEPRNAVIRGNNGAIVFEQTDIEVPVSWSQLATNVVVSKYFRGAPGTPERETSVRQLIGRVADTLAEWGKAGSYFASSEDAEAFRDDLTYLLLHQYASFNSPVWFNLGVESDPQCSACFINSVQDSMDSIMDLARTEARLFKFGSGSGVNLSALRGSAEQLSGGGIASGPLSFMRGLDSFAGAIKSGGKTRRAAKMVILDVDHPDIEEFIECKALEEKKAWSLIDSGYDGSLDGEAYKSVAFQNSNNSIRVTDSFMEATQDDGPWKTRSRVSGEPVKKMRAKELLSKMAAATHLCGDPGIQFDDTINEWNTCKTSGRINASNPCSEYMFLDNSACNLASLNLMKFRDAEGEFDPQAFRWAVGTVFTAQEIIVGNAGYPTQEIGRNSLRYRPLGIGFANLGALLMARGLPYDSSEGRSYAALVTALMTGEAYAQSGRLARAVGPFEAFDENRNDMLGVMEKHREQCMALERDFAPTLADAAREAWTQAVELGEKFGYRNAQASVLAPTGTIGFMMDCDTTGIEPDIALVKHKKLVGGGTLKLVNTTVSEALGRLGYDEQERDAILGHIAEHETIEGAEALRDEDLPVFDCAFRPRAGSRCIAPSGHIGMMAAVQPFLSGAISKTVNLPNEATEKDIEEVFVGAWRLGLKAVAVYRDGCKRVQPLSTGDDSSKPESVEAAAVAPVRRRLPVERQAMTHKFSIGGHEGYVTVGLYEDGTPGEVFVTMSKEGSTISGLMDCLATSVSIALQYGVPLEVLIRKFSHTRYEPSGYTGNRDIPMAKSITDYLFRWLGLKFTEPAPANEDATGTAAVAAPPAVESASSAQAGAQAKQETMVFATQADAPTCSDCGSLMVRNGACYKCCNCGSSSGCS